MSIRSALSLRYHRLRRVWNYYQRESGLPASAPRGHFYSPLPDVIEGARFAESAFRRAPMEGLAGINLRVDAQREMLQQMIGLYPEFDWTEAPKPGCRFHFNQGYYNRADSLTLYSMMRLHRPRRIVEVGSGFSSALMLDVNDRFLAGETHLTFIEPYPYRLEGLLTAEDRAQTRIIREPVQTAPTEVFRTLASGDFLFIDSSHVSKPGSDVNYLFFEILPRVPVGTFIHVHDVFWPFEYPAEWVAEGRAWNESYLLRAFLTFNDHFEVVFWAPFAAELCPEIIADRMPIYMINKGAAIWIRRVR